MASGVPLFLPGDRPGQLLPRVGMEGASQYKESFLQEIIDRWPNLLPVRDFYSSVKGLFSLGREIPVDIGGGDGRIDNLLVADDGHLVIVETKLWRNPESLRSVFTQVLQYGMAVSQLTESKLECCLRRGDPNGRRLGENEAVFDYLQNLAGRDGFPELDEEFQDNFERWRRDGEILFLIVADGIRPSIERLVHWMNSTVGNKPFQLGSVELSIHDVPNIGQVVVPKTTLRIRESNRITVTVNVAGVASDSVTTTIAGPQTVTTIKPPKIMTDEMLAQQIKANNTQEIAELTEMLGSSLRGAGLETQGLPANIRYGVTVNADYISLVQLSAKYIWFQIPMKTVRVLGDERFVVCKRIINSVAEFYHLSEVDDPSKVNAKTPKYEILTGKVEEFVKAVCEIVSIIRRAAAEGS